jgi:murein DD-endopeptidase MepM/ murein hydrolase activator NlpD
MQEEPQSASKRITPKTLLAAGFAVGLSALALFAAVSAEPSDAAIARKDDAQKAITDTPFDPADTSSFGPRAFLYGGSEFLPAASRRQAAIPAIEAAPEEAREHELTATVMPGDTLGQILDRNEISRQDAQDAIAALKRVFDPRRLTPGQSVTLSLLSDSDGSTSLSRLMIEAEPGRRSIAARQESGKFVADEEHDPITVEPMAFSGTIQSSLFAAGEKAGMPAGALQQLIRLFSYDVDFQRDIQKGDSFEVMVDHRRLPDGTVVGVGEIDYAALTLSGTTLRLYRFVDRAGFVDYYNEKGQSVRKALLRTPVDGARITSGFGMRNHPVLGFSKMHKGVDFATPIGTPVYAAGDGTVEKAGPWDSYGNYLRIRHTATYATAYGHLSGYAKGISAGSRVRQGQIVAYSGNTGRTTGPHLHYEVLVSGTQVNPLNVKMPSGRTLAGDELRHFGKLRDGMKASLAALSGHRKVAEAASPAAPKTR